MKLMLIMLLVTMSGCAQLASKVTLADGTQLSEKAYMAERQFAAEAACYESRKLEMPDNPTPTEMLGFAVASMAMQNATPCSGTNFNDVAIAKTRARWAFAGSFSRALAGAYGIGELADFGKSLANAKGDTTTYNVDMEGVSQSNSSSSTAGSSEMGNGGSNSAADNEARTNTIVIGGNSAVAGDRAAAGDTALVNGDSSLQSFIEGSELKQSPLADEQNDLNNSNGEGFGDNDGGNGVSLDF